MSREELYHIIEQYLEGSLDAEALVAFETRLANEPDLAAEVALHRKLQEELGNPAKRRLRSNLDSLRQQFTEEKNEAPVIAIDRNRRMRVLLSVAAIFLILSLTVWMLFFNTPQKQEIVEDPNKTEQNEELPIENTPKLPGEEDQIVEDQPSDDQDKPPPTDRDLIPDQDALASLEPNARFEQLINNNDQEKELKFGLEQPLENASLTASDDGTVALAFSGMLESFLQDDQEIEISLFKNNSPNTNLNNAIATIALPLEKEEEDEEEPGIAFGSGTVYYFNTNQSLSLQPGLYYYGIHVKGEPDIRYCGKLTVR